jgi:uncharacterized protein (DUF1786 family)
MPDLSEVQEDQPIIVEEHDDLEVPSDDVILEAELLQSEAVSQQLPQQQVDLDDQMAVLVQNPSPLNSASRRRKKTGKDA